MALGCHRDRVGRRWRALISWHHGIPAGRSLPALHWAWSRQLLRPAGAGQRASSRSCSVATNSPPGGSSTSSARVALFALVDRCFVPIRRTAGWLLLPFGRSALYLFLATPSPTAAFSPWLPGCRSPSMATTFDTPWPAGSTWPSSGRWLAGRRVAAGWRSAMRGRAGWPLRRARRPERGPSQVDSAGPGAIMPAGSCPSARRTPRAAFDRLSSPLLGCFLGIDRARGGSQCPVAAVARSRACRRRSRSPSSACASPRRRT